MKILENRRDSNENGWKRMREKGGTQRWIENGEWFGDLEIQSLSNKIINILKVGLGTYKKKKIIQIYRYKKKVKLNFGLV